MFSFSKFEWLVLAAGLLLCPGSPWGAEAESADALFDRLDVNKDGYLSPQELAADEAKRGSWIAVDRDRDGRISRSEFGIVTALPQPQSAAAGATAAPAATPAVTPKQKPKPE